MRIEHSGRYSKKEFKKARRKYGRQIYIKSLPDRLAIIWGLITNKPVIAAVADKNYSNIAAALGTDPEDVLKMVLLVHSMSEDMFASLISTGKFTYDDFKDELAQYESGAHLQTRLKRLFKVIEGEV